MKDFFKKLFSPRTAVRIRGRKRKFFSALFSVFLLGNLFASHHDVGAAEFPGFRDLGSHSRSVEKQPDSKPEAAQDDTENVEALWRASAILARPLLFEHEDCGLFQGKKKTG